MRHAGNEFSSRERWAGGSILVCLVAIAGGVFVKQFSFNPAVLIARDAAPKPSAGNSPRSDSLVGLPPELNALGAPESFTPDNLYDKIDGKAELYLAAGFVQLRCQRFALKDAPDQWLEWFVYDMGNLPQAFSVFSTQRRAEGQTLNVTEYAYQTKNALYFVHGSSYVEAVASSAGEPLMKAMQTLAAHFVAANPAAGSRLSQLEMLPTENLVPGSYALQSADAFGFDQFKNVFTARYHVQDAEAMAFVTACSSVAAADALRDGYRSFLLANGGKESKSGAGGDADKPIEIMGGVEIVFSRGNAVAGIHAAPSVAAAEQLAARLNQRLAQQSR
jgi:hypothetical protein